MKNPVFIILLLGFVLMPYVVAEQYYGDIKIFVESDGRTSISGNTNYPEFNNTVNSQVFTSKNGEYWILNITSSEIFESYVFELNLPLNSEINYIKTTPKFRIDNSESNIKIIGYGENKPLTLLVQYKVKPTSGMFTQNNLILLILIIFITSLLITIIVGYGILKKLKLNLSLKDEINSLKKKAYSLKEKKFHYIREKEKKELEEKIKPQIDLSKYPQRQQEIIKLLQEKKQITQKELEERMNIPKSSVSRNVKTLVTKGIIIKESKGISNFLSLKED